MEETRKERRERLERERLEAEKNASNNTPEETKKVSTVTKNETEEETGKIFNLGDNTHSDSKTTPTKKVETNPVKAWGKK